MKFKSVKIENLRKTKSENIDLEYITKGGFAQVYKNKAGMIISFVDIDDKSRQYINNIQSEFIPNIAYLGAYYVNSEVKDVYISELYFSADSNFLAQELSFYFSIFANDIFNGKVKDHNKLLVEYLESKIDNLQLVNTIKAIYKNLAEVEKTYILEFQLYNLMQDKNGNLILLDNAYFYA